VITDDVAGTNNHEKPANRRYWAIDNHAPLPAQRENASFEAIPIFAEARTPLRRYLVADQSAGR
jgi:hypothetical protein